MAGSRKALLIATDSYSDPRFSRLHASAADLAGLHAVLSDPAIGGYAATPLLNVSEPVVTRAIEDFFADASREDELLLYVSGHGVKDEDGQLYLATADSRHDRLGSTSVPARFLHDQMSRSRSRRIVVLLDCCYSGAFPSGLRHRGADRIDVLSQLGGRGYAVMTSSSALEYSYERVGETAGPTPPADPSVFTGIVIDGLRTGEADLGRDGLIDIDELYDYAYDRVSTAVPGQTPQKKFELGGTLYIARSVRDGRPLPPPPSPPAPAPPCTPVTVSNSRQEMMRRDLGRVILSALAVAVWGGMTHDWGLGHGIFHPDNADSGAVTYLEFLLAVFAGGLWGVIAMILNGTLATSDTLTLDSAKLTVTRKYTYGFWRNRRRDLYFWILWSTIERIIVEDGERGAVLRVWFRHGHEPPAWWLAANAIRTRADSSVDLYRGSGRLSYPSRYSHPSTVDVRRLRALLPRYAGHLYDGPTRTPGP
jgi:hypothetical protein